MKGDIAEFRCPNCHGPLTAADRCWRCEPCDVAYSLTHRGIPILFSERNVLFAGRDYVDASPGVVRTKPRILAPSVNLSRERILSGLRSTLPEDARILLVGAGGQRREIEALLRMPVTALDVDKWAEVDVFADAHEMPFPSSHFDAVVTTAVLEHVVAPSQVVGEIVRVLKVGGLVYSEFPFMQQVHEGAYDFTRVTLGGHRAMFRDFTEVSAGAVAGPGTALVWSLEHFMLALTNANTAKRRNAVKGGVRLLFGWVSRLDRRIADRPAGIDAASCTFFLGLKREAPSPTHDLDVIMRYEGAQQLRHS